MYKNTLPTVILLVSILIGCTPKRPDIIERPVFEVWNTTALEIDKIEMSDSATIIHFDAFYAPGSWIRIDSKSYIRESGTDENLLLVKADGIPLDEEYFMPESGQTSFKLFFPPLAPNVTKIDFIESDCENCFKIIGIELLPDAKIKMASMPSSKNAAESGLPEPVFSNAKSVIKGSFYGYCKEVGIKSLSLQNSNPVYLADGSTKLTISPDGTFSGEVAVGFPSLIGFDRFSSLFLIPGTTNEIIIDLKRKSRLESRYRTDKEDSDSTFIFIKDHLFTANDYKLLRQVTDDLQNFETVIKETGEMSPQEYQEYFNKRIEAKMSEINQLEVSDNLKRLMEAQVKAITLQFLFYYESIYREAFFWAKKITGPERRQTNVVVPKPDSAYYAYALKLISDDMAMTSLYASLVSYLQHGETFGRNEGTPPDQINSFRKKISPYLNEDSETLYDVALAGIYSSQLDTGFYSDETKKEIRGAFQNKAFATELISRNDEFLAIVEANKTATGGDIVINETPDISPDKMFETILSKYRGKVVVVDFWATWCAPCINAMEAIKPLKESMKTNKDVVFVYLTGITSPLGTWNKMIPDIHGEHYRVSGEQWQYWYQNFGIEGVPTYMVIDKSGQQISRHTGFPGVDAVKGSIEKGLL